MTREVVHLFLGSGKSNYHWDEEAIYMHGNG